MALLCRARCFCCPPQRRTSLQRDSPGKGRKPWLVDPTAVVVLTRAGPSVSLLHGIRNSLQIPVSRAPGAHCFVEPYRWDAKVFTIVLQGTDCPTSATGGTAGAREAAEAAGQRAAHYKTMCEATGGRCYTATGVRHTR